MVKYPSPLDMGHPSGPAWIILSSQISFIRKMNLNRLIEDERIVRLRLFGNQFGSFVRAGVDMDRSIALACGFPAWLLRGAHVSVSTMRRVLTRRATDMIILYDHPLFSIFFFIKITLFIYSLTLFSENCFRNS